MADGSAMFITVRSSTTISCARPITPRMSQRRSGALLLEVASAITFTTPFSIYCVPCGGFVFPPAGPRRRYAEALRAVLRTAASGEGW